MAQIEADEPLAVDEDDSFTLQEYFTVTKPKRLRRFPHLVRVSLRLVLGAAKRELAEIVAMEAVEAAGVGVELLLVRSLLTHLVAHTHHAHNAGLFSAILPQLIAIAVLTIVLGTLGAMLGLRARLLAQLVARRAVDAVVQTAIEVDLITYDAPGFHDRLQRATLAASGRPAMMVQDLLGSIGSLLSVGAIAGALLIIQPLFCVIVVVAYIPIWFTTHRAGRLGFRQTVEQTERERMRRYLFDTLTTKPPAQEVRAFGIGRFLAERQDAIYGGLIDEVRQVLRRRMRLALIGQVGSALLTGLALAVLIWLVSTGRMSLAAAGSAAGAMVLLSGRLAGIAGSTAGLYENSLYLEDYFAFVEAAPRLATRHSNHRLPHPPQVLRVEHVSFTYPSRRTPSIDDVSLVLRRGEVVALVGENGSGKTTFAKVLSGLYMPGTGRVRWDGVNVEELSPEERSRHVSVIFQDFTRYLLSAHDNIALGNTERYRDRDAVRRAAGSAGIDGLLAGLRHGYDTILGPAYYGGSDLSGGQWQRIALARLFFRDAPIVVLDEPTASLDPRAEAELYANMRELFRGRGVLLISHRFASVRTADRIYVLREGRIVEAGSHEALLAAGGYYAELFELQAQQFRS